MQTAPVQKLSQLQAALNAEESPIMRQVFSVLFPFGPALNSILGTFYISSCVLANIPNGDWTDPFLPPSASQTSSSPSSPPRSTATR